MGWQQPGLRAPSPEGSWAPPAMGEGSRGAEPSGTGSFPRVRAGKSRCFTQELGGVAGTALTGVTAVLVRDQEEILPSKLQRWQPVTAIRV